MAAQANYLEVEPAEAAFVELGEGVVLGGRSSLGDMQDVAVAPALQSLEHHSPCLLVAVRGGPWPCCRFSRTAFIATGSPLFRTLSRANLHEVSGSDPRVATLQNEFDTATCLRDRSQQHVVKSDSTHPLFFFYIIMQVSMLARTASHVLFSFPPASLM
jgi:hypothetical protein